MRNLRRVCGIGLAATAVLAATVGTAAAEPAATTPLSDQDRSYLLTSHQTNMAEIALGARAAVSSCAAVRDLGAMLVADHTRLEAMSAPVAFGNGVALSPLPDADHMATLQRVSTLTGPDFDQQWLRTQQLGHLDALAAGQNEALYGTSAQVRQLADAASPVVAQHLVLARQAVTRC